MVTIKFKQTTSDVERFQCDNRIETFCCCMSIDATPRKFLKDGTAKICVRFKRDAMDLIWFIDRNYTISYLNVMDDFVQPEPAPIDPNSSTQNENA